MPIVFPKAPLPGTLEADNLRSVAIRNPGFCLDGDSAVGDPGGGASPPWVCEANFDDILDSHPFLVGGLAVGVAIPLVSDGDAVV